MTLNVLILLRPGIIKHITQLQLSLSKMDYMYMACFFTQPWFKLMSWSMKLFLCLTSPVDCAAEERHLNSVPALMLSLNLLTWVPWSNYPIHLHDITLWTTQHPSLWNNAQLLKSGHFSQTVFDTRKHSCYASLILYCWMPWSNYPILPHDIALMTVHSSLHVVQSF